MIRRRCDELLVGLWCFKGFMFIASVRLYEL